MSRMSTKLISEFEPGDETTWTIYCARTDRHVRTMRTVENRCSWTSTSVWLVHGRWRYCDLYRSWIPKRWTIQSCSSTGEAWASRRRSMEKIRCLSIQQWTRRETSIRESSGQKYRKEILPLGEQVLARRLGARVNEHHRATREMDNQENQHIEMPWIQYTDKVADDSVAVQRQISPRTTETKHRICKQTVNICKQLVFRLIDLAHEITGVKVAQKTWHKLLDDRQHANERSHIAPTKEVVADDTANSNHEYHISCQPNDTEWFLQELGGTFSNRERGGDWRSDTQHGFSRDKSVRRSAGVIFVQTPVQCSFRTRSWWNNTVWHTFRVNLGARSRVIKGLNEKHSKFEIEQVNVTDTHSSAWLRPSITENRSITERLAKATVKTQAKGKANTYTLWKRISLLKQPQQCWPLQVATSTRTWNGWDPKQRHGDWYTVDTRRTLLTAEMISGSLFHDHADEQQPTSWWVCCFHGIEGAKSKPEDLAGTQSSPSWAADLASTILGRIQTKFRDEHNEISKTMKDLWILQHQAELEEKAGNEQQLHKEMSMVAQDNDAKTWWCEFATRRLT